MWKDIVADSEFQGLDQDKKQTIAKNYFARNIGNDIGFLELPDIDKKKIETNFFSGITPSEKLPSRSLFGDIAASAYKGIVSGIADTEKSLGTGLKMAGSFIGSDRLKEIGGTVSDYWGDIGKQYEAPASIQGDIISKPGLLKDPSWWVYNISKTAPGMFASMVPGVAAGKYIKIGGEAVKLSPKLIDVLSRVGTAITGGAVGGGLEGTQTYDKVKEMGGTDEEATSAALKMLAASGGLNAISMDSALGKAGTGLWDKVKHILASGGTEALTESAEEPSEAVILKQTLGDKIPQSYGALLKGSIKPAATVAPIAFVTGAAGGGAGLVLDSKSRREIPSFEPEVTPEPQPESPPIAAVRKTSTPEKGETRNAEGVRGDAGQIQEGRNEGEVGREKGGNDLERQAQGQGISGAGTEVIPLKTIKQPKGVIERGQGQGYGQAAEGQVTPVETRVSPEEKAATTALQPGASPAIAATPPVTTYEKAQIEVLKDYPELQAGVPSAQIFPQQYGKLAGKELIGTVNITNEGLAFKGIRYGSEFGDTRRGGTWYEIPAFEGAKSSYEAGKWYSRESDFGVGGKEKFEKDIILKNPYLFDWTGMGEGYAPYNLAKKVLGEEVAKKLSRGIKGIDAEKAFAKIENALSGKLKEQGYDGVIFYDSATRKGDILHPKQAFIFKQTNTVIKPEASPATAATSPVTTIKESLKVEPTAVAGLKEPSSKPAKWLETTGTTKTVLNKEEQELLLEAGKTTPEIYHLVKDELVKPNIVQEIKEFASQINTGQSLKDHFPGEEYNTLLKSAPGFFSDNAKYSFDEVSEKLGITGDELKSKLVDLKKRKDKLDSAKQMIEDYKNSYATPDSEMIEIGKLKLKVGTEFKINGEKYKVISRDENGGFVIKDGDTYTLDESQLIPKPDEGSIKQPSSKIKQTKFEYDKTKVDIHPKMESSLTVPALQKGQKGFFDKAGITPLGEKKISKESLVRGTLVEQLKTAQPNRPAADIEMTVDLAINPLAKALGMSPEAVADTYIQEIKKSTTEELKGKQNIQHQVSGLPQAVEEKISNSLITKTYDATIQKIAMIKYGKARGVTIQTSKAHDQAWAMLRRELIDTPKGYDIVGQKPTLTDKEYLEGKRNEILFQVSANKAKILGIENDVSAIEFASLSENSSISNKAQLSEAVKNKVEQIRKSINDLSSDFYRKEFNVHKQIEEAKIMRDNGELMGEQLDMLNALEHGLIDKDEYSRQVISSVNIQTQATLQNWERYLYNNATYSRFFVPVMLDKIAKQIATTIDGIVSIRTLGKDTFARLPMPLDIESVSRFYSRLQRGEIKQKNWLIGYLEDMDFVTQERIKQSTGLETKGEFANGKWIHFKNEKEVDKNIFDKQVADLTILAQKTPWCTKDNARGQLSTGEHWVFVDDIGNARATFFLEQGKIRELRGILPGQNIEPELSDIVIEFAKKAKLAGGEIFVNEELLKSELKKYRDANSKKINNEDIKEIALKYNYQVISEQASIKGKNNKNIDLTSTRVLDDLFVNINTVKISSKVDYNQTDILDLLGYKKKIPIEIERFLFNLKSVKGDLYAGKATTINMPALQSVGGSFNAENATTIDMPALQSVGGSFRAGNARTINTPKMKNILKQDKRGAIEFLPNGKAIIHILENADESTFIHEMFHLYIYIMEHVPELKPQLTILENWIGKPADKWTVADREKIARGGEKYLWEGNAPTSTLKAVFEKFKTWLREIYKAATSLDVKLSDDVRKMWDTWFAGEDITASEETLRGRESGILFQSDTHKETFVEKVLNIPKNWNAAKTEYNQFKELGIIEVNISDDFKSKVRQWIQFPLTVAKKYLKFDRIYRRAEQYFKDFENYAKTLGAEINPYIKGDNQKVINALLIYARLNKDAAYTNEELKALGHSDEIIKEYRAVTKTMSDALKHMASMLARTNNNIEKIYTYISNIKSGDIKLYTELEDKTNVNKALSKTNWDKPFTSEELKGQGLSSEEIQAYNSVSDMMDKDSNYVPFSRYGDWFVAVRDTNGALIHYSFHEKQGQARIEAVQQAKKYADSEGYKVITGDVRRLASESVEGVPVNMQPLIQMLDDEFAEGVTKKNDEEVTEKPKKNLDITASATYAEIIKRGFAGHFIESKNIEGFERNLSKSISDYILGISRWMASKEARFDFETLLNGKKDENGKQVGGIHPYDQAQLYGYSKRYIKYILGNSREGSNVRLFMFRYYLGGLVRPALLNFTQPLTTTLPTSGMYIQGGIVRRFKLLMDAFKAAAIPLETLKRSNPNLAMALEQAIKDGKISEQMVKMLRGEVYGKKLYKFDKALSFMFEFSEQANRKSAFIMMYQEAVTNGVKVEGKLQKLSHQEAINFAEAFVTKTQFEYSKLNRPEMARGWKAPLFTFRMFSGSYLSLLKSFVKEGEFKTLAEALGIMVLLGGATAFPGLKELEKALEIAGYDPKLYVKKLAGKWGDLFLHGVFYPLGIDVSGALSPPALIPGELQQGVVPAVGGLVLGVLADIPKRIERAWNIFTKQGDAYRTIETLMPEAPRNMMASVRWWKEGEVKTAAYEPIAKVSHFDMALKFFGIQPSVLSKAYEKKHSELILNANNASEGYNWRIAKAFYNHDSTKVVNIIKDIQQHNQSITKQIQKTKDYTLAKDLIIVTKTGIAGQLLKMKRPEVVREKSMPKQFRPAYQEIQNINQ